MNAVILFVLIVELISMIYIFNRVSNMKSLVDKIADGVKDLYLQIDHATRDIHIVDLKIDSIYKCVNDKHLGEQKKYLRCYKDRLNDALLGIHRYLNENVSDYEFTNDAYRMGKKTYAFELHYPLHADVMESVKKILENNCICYDIYSTSDGQCIFYIFKDKC